MSFLSVSLLLGIATGEESATTAGPLDALAWNATAAITEGESPYLGRLHQFTTDGENAEAYWHQDGTQLVYQRTPHAVADDAPAACDQIYAIDLLSGEQRLVSTGAGRTTCSFFIPNSDRLIFASTHAHDAACPAKPDYSRGYVWPIYADYDIYSVLDDGSGLTPVVTSPDYDAEGVTDPTGSFLVYTSLREGDLNVWVRNLRDNTEIQVTHEPGYDGGAVFSPDGTKIAWRAHHPKDEKELADYQGLLGEHLIRPTTLDLYIANADGTDIVQLTDNQSANFAPIFTPDGKSLLFSSNLDAPGSREFELYMLDIATKEITQVTHSPGFDGFPMFSYDGKYLAFCSNRNGSHEGNTNVFVAEWVGLGGLPMVAQ